MIILLLACITHQSPGWVDGPEAPASKAALPPAVAPRDGEPGAAPPQETLVVPPVPGEDPRVVVDDGLLRPLPERRFETRFDRRELAQRAALDLDTFLDRALIPGLVWLPQSAGRSLPTARGLRSDEISVVVDGVPLLDGYGLVSVTESIGLLAPARLSFRHGPRADSPLSSSSGGVLVIDTGGALDDTGESLRLDGLLAGGFGGPDNEKGATTLVRTGWRLLRVTAHATLLHREDFRQGRVPAELPLGVDGGSATVGHSGGVGGSAGARVDVVPFDAARLFVSWQAGRVLDTGDPRTCSAVDVNGRSVDCLRAKERGTDVVIAGFDVVREAFGLTVQPSVRVHAQRSVDDVERFGSTLTFIDTARDQVNRSGARLALEARADTVQFLDQLEPSVVVAADLFADRFASEFFSRSLRFRDAEPDDLGIADPLRARFVDDALVSQGLLSATARVDGQLVGLWAIGRLAAQSISAPKVIGRFDDDVSEASALPGGELGARLHLTNDVDVIATVGHLGHAADARAVLPGTAVGDPVTESFAEAGVQAKAGFVDVDTLVWGSLRSSDVGALGIEGRATVRPGVEGLSLQAVVAAVVADEDVLGEEQEPLAGVIQPQGGLELRYAPSSWPTGFFVRVQGAVPQNRLSADEAVDPALCPELVEGVLQAPCSGAPGFATADIGAWLKLGQLRFDVVGENIGDLQGSWRGAALGTGGTAVRARVAFLF
ncbi:MAG: hypothetical protein Q8O67_10125 [Deltaproteobacteria bacterium]|nr:hypothetical protein [Deltaproteobacteria bacterium]